ncbi:MAG: hypothetical protein ACREN5_02565, partial [Gemmatimonadales bacterium]
PDGSYQLLWTADNLAHVWTINADNTFGGAFGLLGPGPGWEATSYSHAPDGSHHVLWTTAQLAHLWIITPTLGSGDAIGLVGPGDPAASIVSRAQSYSLNSDGSWDVLWAIRSPESPFSAAHLWTISVDRA